MPRAATVEDEFPSPLEEQPELRRYPSLPVSATVAPAKEDTPKEATSTPSVAEIQRGFEDLLLSRTPPSFKLRATQTTSNNEIPVTRGAAARDKWFAELAGACHDRQTGFRVRGPSVPAAAPTLSQTSSYSVYCNNCNGPIPDEHYHCSTCDDGDYDLCQTCIDSGILCGGEGHWMIKRFVKNGKVITSTTETLAPRPSRNESKTTLVEVEETEVPTATRTCNSCISCELQHQLYTLLQIY
jgi:next-to-BRCA1 protein 1